MPLLYLFHNLATPPLLVLLLVFLLLVPNPIFYLVSKCRTDIPRTFFPFLGFNEEGVYDASDYRTIYTLVGASINSHCNCQLLIVLLYHHCPWHHQD